MTNPARAARWRPFQHFTGRTLAGLLVIVAAGTGFGLLLLLVRFRWGPLWAVDRGVAADLNAVVSRNDPVVAVLHAVTSFGGRPIMLWILAAAVALLLIRRQPRLAAYLVTATVGSTMLDPALKLIVGRLRPVVDVPVAAAPGNSFPSGHALGSMVAYGALLLVFLPAVPRRARPYAFGLAGLLIAAVGFTRVALGVHYLSDVVAGWLLGLAWLGVTAHAFRVMRRDAGRPARPLAEGLEPEAAGEITPAPDEDRLMPHPWAGAAEIVTGWVLTVGVLFVFGVLVSRYSKGSSVETLDAGVTGWLAGHRTPVLNDLSWYWSKAGDTHAILFVALVICPLLVALTRRWRPVLYLALALIGELTLFLVSAKAVNRPRPPVEHLDGQLPTAAFPSGHIAATMCLYGGIALLVMPRTDRWWRWMTVALAVIMPLGVATSRMYRGMHHPTDVIGALILTLMWLTLLYIVVRPNEEAAARAGDDVQHPQRRIEPVTGDHRGDPGEPARPVGVAGTARVRR